MKRVGLGRFSPAVSVKPHGLSLIELMVALAIGLVIIGALLTLFINITRNNNEMAKMNRQIENGRFAIQLLQNDLWHAGFWGDYIPQFEDRSIAAPGDTPNAVPDPCLPVASWTTAHRNNLVGIPVQDVAGTCGVVSDQMPNTDLLVVRFAETIAPNPGASCAAGEVCFQASQCAAEINATPPRRYVLGTTGFDLEVKGCSDATPGATTVQTAAVRRMISHLYYVRNDGVLMRSEYRNGAHQPAQPLIEGIDALRVEYGIDSIGRTGTPVSYTGTVSRGDGVADQYVTCSPCTFDQLTNVVAVRVHVLARNLEATQGYIDNKTYNLGNTAPIGPFNDGFKRHVFTTTVRLVNPAGRRDAP
jgi:type IV pilus assembly protein PilW